MISAETLVALHARGLTIEEATRELGIAGHTFIALLRKYRLKWSQARPCRYGHPLHDRIKLGTRRRCRLCYLAELERRKGCHSLKHVQRSEPAPYTRAQIEEEARLQRQLDAAVANETAMPWERLARTAP